MASTWAWIARRREREVLGKCLEHLDKIIEVVEASRELFKAYSSGSLEKIGELYQKVFDKEREADDVKLGILADLSTGMIHPIDREELIRLVLASDDIAAHIKAASRRLTLLKGGSLPPGAGEGFLTMIERVLEATRLLREAVESLIKDPRRSIELANRVERLEEENDETRMGLEESIVSWCNENETGSCILVYNILNSIENASDECEDVGDVVRSIALLSL